MVTLASVGSALRSTINMMAIDGNRSRFLSISFKCSDIKDYFGLHEQHRNHFFSEINFNKKIPLLSFKLIEDLMVYLHQYTKAFYHHYNFYQTYMIQKNCKCENVQCEKTNPVLFQLTINQQTNRICFLRNQCLIGHISTCLYS